MLRGSSHHSFRTNEGPPDLILIGRISIVYLFSSATRGGSLPIRYGRISRKATVRRVKFFFSKRHWFFFASNQTFRSAGSSFSIA
jgi:hypothetical protein